MPAGAVLIFPAALMAVSHTLLALFPTFAVLLVGTVGSTVAYGGKIDPSVLMSSKLTPAYTQHSGLALTTC
jgi:predicted MFS family arabinose efflux permease